MLAWGLGPSPPSPHPRQLSGSSGACRGVRSCLVTQEQLPLFNLKSDLHPLRPGLPGK